MGEIVLEFLPQPFDVATHHDQVLPLAAAKIRLAHYKLQPPAALLHKGDVAMLFRARFSIMVVVIVSLPATTCPVLSAPGEVLSDQKISDEDVEFTGELHDGDSITLGKTTLLFRSIL